MHGVTVPGDQQPSQATIPSASHPPIGPYHRISVQVHQADPHAPQVARRLKALIATCWPATWLPDAHQRDVTAVRPAAFLRPGKPAVEVDSGQLMAGS